MNRSGEERGSVTPYQMTTIVVGACVGVGVLAFPRLLVEQAGSGAPLSALLGAIPVTLAWLALSKLNLWYRGKTVVEYAPLVLTRPVGWLWSLALILLQVVLTALTVREFGDVVRTAVLRNTPIEINIILLLLTATFCVRYDVQVFARVFEVFFPLMLVPLTVIGLISLKNARFSYLLPINGPGWGDVLVGALFASVGYVAYLSAAILLPSLNLPKRATRAGLSGIGLTLFIYLLAVTASLSVFSTEEMKRLIWPTFELVKTTTVPGFILERLESAFLGIWVAAVFTTVSATYYTALLAAQQLLKLRDHKVLAIPLAPVLYMIAMAPQDIQSLYSLVRVVGLAGVGITVGGPLLLFCVGWLRKRGVPANAGPTG